MTLAARLLFTFGLMAILATVLFLFSARGALKTLIESDFTDRMNASAVGAQQELSWEAESLRGLLSPLCAHDTFVDNALLELEKAQGQVDAMDPGRRIAIRHFVPDQAAALRLDELVLLTGNGVVLGADDPTRIGTREPKMSALLAERAGGGVRLRPRAPGGKAVLEVHCARSSKGVSIGLVGARKIEPILQRVGTAYGVTLAVSETTTEKAGPYHTSDLTVQVMPIPSVQGLSVVVSVSRDSLKRGLLTLDRSILVSGAATLVLALLIAVVLARSLSRPIVALARETREVVSGEPRPVRARGGREITELAGAFNKTIDELMQMRKRLVAIERIAARREVARQIAHEIKNPLAPIRAAVETLRRLRAREDPAFDEYFEEATATVLNEVHRITNIVTQFTQFERLPAPDPAPMDLVAAARGVVTLHNSGPDGGAAGREPRVDLVVEPVPMVTADKDQIVQVLTNLVQNGLDAASAVRDDPRVVVTVGPLPNDRVRIVVRDNGPGVSEEMLPRLFEPYATSKAKGTGLGLAIVRRMVFEHGGEITYRKATKGGAVFEIWLPVSGPPLLEKSPLPEATERTFS